MLIKICGLTRRGDAEAAIAAGADLVGFVFVPGTRRAVDSQRVSWVRELAGAETVGVFRDTPVEEILRVRELLELDWVQLHGDEPDSDLELIGGKLLRRVPVDNGKVDWARVEELAEICVPLIDPGAGDGHVSDWRKLAEGRREVDFGLAGGLDAGNVGRAITMLRPMLVDVSSGVESAPGIKETALMEELVDAVRMAAGGE
jgi:phosphoribosylanthranilate isomerase